MNNWYTNRKQAGLTDWVSSIMNGERNNFGDPNPEDNRYQQEATQADQQFTMFLDKFDSQKRSRLQQILNALADKLLNEKITINGYLAKVLAVNHIIKIFSRMTSEIDRFFESLVDQCLTTNVNYFVSV